MIVSVELVSKVFADRDLDKIEVWDQAKRMLLADAEGKAECLQLLSEMPSMVDGVFRVVGSSRSTTSKKVYEWVCEGDNDPAPVGAAVGGPSWDQLMDVRLELQELKIRNELANPAADPMAQLLALFDKATAAPAAAPAPVAAVAAAAPDGELSPAVLAACRQIALIARHQPELFAQYAPVLAQAAGETSSNG